MLEVVSNNGIEVYQLTESTVAWNEGAMVRLNQLDPLGDQQYDYDTVFISKQNIIKLAHHFIVNEGKPVDLSYKEVKDMIRDLQSLFNWEAE